MLSAAVFIFAHFDSLTRHWVINDDVRQQIFWMQQWGDPELFPGDLLADYARAYVTWGVKGLYRLAWPLLNISIVSKWLPFVSFAALSLGGKGLWLSSPVAAPITFSKWLPGLLFVFLGCCLFRIGARLGSRSLAWFMAGIYWLLPFFLDHLAGGLARAFAAPLLAFFCLCWLAARPWGLALALLLQALFIPYIFLTGALAVVLAWLAARTGRWAGASFLNRGHLLTVAAGAGLVWLMNQEFNAAGFGPLVSAADMAGRPEFTAAGRYAIYPAPSILWEVVSPWEFIAPFHEGGIILGALGCVLLMGAAVWGARSLDWRELKPKLQPFCYLFLASVLLYFLARIFMLKLFVPDRYLVYTLNLCYLVGLALCLHAALYRRPWPRVAAAAVLIVVAFLGGLRLQSVGLFDYSMYRPLYAALSQTPKNALIAGHPNLMDNVPTFAQRPALATFELAHPWSKGYWEQLRPRLEDFFTAYYAEDPQVVRDFCKKYGVSFLVVDDRHFAPEFLAGGRFLVPFDPPLARKRKRLEERAACPFFAPFDARIKSLAKDPRHFVLLDRELFPGLEVDKHQRLLDMRQYRR
ncbi:MAG: hypothetical protein C4567_12175 [Deltaproteobacteria bacterium]|nr:MAG: hypothetical protein C4567_12175 [Deltaproteobacteria bacterium]